MTFSTFFSIQECKSLSNIPPVSLEEKYSVCASLINLLAYSLVLLLFLYLHYICTEHHSWILLKLSIFPFSINSLIYMFIITVWTCFLAHFCVGQQTWNHKYFFYPIINLLRLILTSMPHTYIWKTVIWDTYYYDHKWRDSQSHNIVNTFLLLIIFN